MHLGTELRRIRKTYRQTLAEVSGATGISVSFLSAVETGRTKPSLDTLDKLSSYYAVPVEQLIATSKLGGANGSNHPNLPGFGEFVKQMGGTLSDSMKSLLIHVDANARQQAQTKDDWMRYYYLLATIVE